MMMMGRESVIVWKVAQRITSDLPPTSVHTPTTRRGGRQRRPGAKVLGRDASRHAGPIDRKLKGVDLHGGVGGHLGVGVGDGVARRMHGLGPRSTSVALRGGRAMRGHLRLLLLLRWWWLLLLRLLLLLLLAGQALRFLVDRDIKRELLENLLSGGRGVKPP